MKRSLAALALGCVGALPLSAHGQLANVRLYGNLNLDFELVRGEQPDGSNPTVNRVSSNSSRFGIRGNEYLGRGQVAIFQVESSLQADTGGSTLASRETFVGLQGDWGTAKFGKFLTPYDDILTIFGNTPTLTTSILSTAAIWAQGPLSKVQGGFDARLGNSLRYETPPLGGLTGEVQYSTRDSSGNADSADNGDHVSELRHAYVIGAGAFYSKGPLDLGVAYERNSGVRFANTNDDAFSIAAGYDIGTLFGSSGLRLGAVYERLSYGTPTGDLKRDFWGVSAIIPAGGGSVYAFCGRAGNGKGDALDGTTIGGLTKGPDSASEQWEVSYSYPLSLRTLLYAGFVRINNQKNAGYGFNINDYPVAPGARPTGYVFGMAHFF
ncbi:MAG TPA: porin [Casimicrobiaceae bacterium]|nr:porin [Casimicrobiaceae bacterium]